MDVKQQLNVHLNKKLDEQLTRALGWNKYRSVTKEAEYLGISRGAWINFRYGKSNFTTDKLVMICSKLGITMADLFEGFQH